LKTLSAAVEPTKEKQDFSALIPPENEMCPSVSVSQEQEKEEMMLSGRRQVSLCKHMHMS